MAKAVIDTTVLVSAFLRSQPGGASYDLLRFAREGKFELYLSDDIIEETGRVLATDERNRRRYGYDNDRVVEYCQGVARMATIVQDIPTIQVVRDPNDDMILACAVRAGADYLISRDKDLLSIGEYQGTYIVSPETFLYIVRAAQEW